MDNRVSGQRTNTTITSVTEGTHIQQSFLYELPRELVYLTGSIYVCIYTISTSLCVQFLEVARQQMAQSTIITATRPTISHAMRM